MHAVALGAFAVHAFRGVAETVYTDARVALSTHGAKTLAHAIDTRAVGGTINSDSAARTPHTGSVAAVLAPDSRRLVGGRSVGVSANAITAGGILSAHAAVGGTVRYPMHAVGAAIAHHAVIGLAAAVYAESGGAFTAHARAVAGPVNADIIVGVAAHATDRRNNDAAAGAIGSLHSRPGGASPHQARALPLVRD